MVVSVIPDTRRPKADGTFPLRLRITKGNDRYYFATGLHCTPEQYERAIAPKPRADAKELREQINAVTTAANTVLKNLPAFTPELFRQKYLNNAIAENDVFSVFENVIAELRAEKRIGSANCYRDAARSFQAFVRGDMKQPEKDMKTGKAKPIRKQKPLMFENVTPEFLKRYSEAMGKAGNSATTTAMHCRAIRRIFNVAIEQGIVSPDCYPFRRQAASVGKKFSVPVASGNKRALSMEQVSALMNCENLTPAEKKALDLWLFSMFANGLNFADILRLRRSDITLSDDIHIISCYRQKTIRRPRRKQVQVALPPELWAHVERIISEHGNPDKSASALLFPALTEAQTPEDEKQRVADTLRHVNKLLKKVASKSGLDIALSTYYARHTYAMMLLRSGATIAEISSALAHANVIITEDYLTGLAPEQVAKTNARAFKNLRPKAAS